MKSLSVRYKDPPPKKKKNKKLVRSLMGFGILTTLLIKGVEYQYSNCFIFCRHAYEDIFRLIYILVVS